MKSSMTEKEFKVRQMMARISENIASWNCAICEKDITQSVRVVCPEASNTTEGQESLFVYCLVCLMNGKEYGGHKRTHDYMIMDRLNFPLFTPEFTAKEEMQLLHGLSKVGMDNFQEIASTLHEKSARDCDVHYYSFYIKSKEDPYINIDQDCIFKGRDRNLRPVIDQEQLKRNRETERAVQQIKKEKDEREAREQEENEQAEQATQTNKKAGSRQNQSTIHSVSDVVGYMPKRGDFDTEYDNEADMLLADMEFNIDDTEEEIKLKSEVIELYNARLDERIRRKKFVIERGILDVKKIQKNERKKTQEEKDIINAMKVFARFNDKDSHEKLVQSLIKERQLREVIEQLKFFRQKGLKTLDECEKFIEHLKKKDPSAEFSRTQQFIENPKDLIGNKEALALQSLHSKEHLQPAAVKVAMNQKSFEQGYEKLTEKEKAIVVNQGLDIALYLALKNELKVDSARNKLYDLKNFQEIVRRVVDADQAVGSNEKGAPFIAKIQPLFDFFVDARLIKKKK